MILYSVVFGMASGGQLGKTIMATDFTQAVTKANTLKTTIGAVSIKSISESGYVEIVTI